MSRRNRHKQQSQNTVSLGDRPPGRPRVMNDMPRPTNVAFVPISCLGPNDPPPPPSGGENGPTPPPRESRANATKAAPVPPLVPLEMLDKINALSAEYASQLKLVTESRSVVRSRGRPQQRPVRRMFDKLQINKLRVIERAGTSYDDDCTERFDRIAAKLPCGSFDAPAGPGSIEARNTYINK